MNRNLYWGLLAGLGTGIVAGLVLAPKAGKELLADLSSQTDNWRGQLRDQWAHLVGGQSGGRKADAVQDLEQHRDELVHADFNNPADLPHRPRLEMPTE